MEARFVKNLDTKVQAGQFYDAHQLCRAIFERFSKRADIDGALDFAEKYADIFADKEQYELTVNLGQSALALLEDHKVAPTVALLDRLSTFFLLCTPHSTATKYDFMNKLITWSHQCEELTQIERREGSHTLQALIADAYLAERKFGSCQNHLVFCDDANSLIELLTLWQAVGYPSEKYYFSLRLILILLCRGRIAVATELLKTFEVDWDDEKSVPPGPAQCAYLLCVASRERDASLLEFVQRKYALILRVDPQFQGLMQAIEEKVFHIKHKDTGMMGMLKDMLSGSQQIPQLKGQ